LVVCATILERRLKNRIPSIGLLFQWKCKFVDIYTN
jgi:hypothetical protein